MGLAADDIHNALDLVELGDARPEDYFARLLVAESLDVASMASGVEGTRAIICCIGWSQELVVVAKGEGDTS